MRVTIREVARRAGVSPATVSYVLNGTAVISPETREAVLAAVRELDYHPNSMARGLAHRRTFTVGLSVPRSRMVSDPFLLEYIAGVGDACAAAGYGLLLLPPGPDGGSGDSSGIAAVKAGRVDGLLLLEAEVQDPRIPQLLADKVPFVLFGRSSEHPELVWIDVDGAAGGRMATEFLLGRGHNRIAHLAAPLRYQYARDRLAGYQAALIGAGLAASPDLVVEGDLSEAGAHSAMHRLLGLPQPPTAVFAASDLMAAGAIRAAAERGLKVPDQLAVVGFDNARVAGLTDPPLTTVEQPIAHLGQRAAGLLLSLVGGEEPPDRGVLVIPRLIVRASA